MLFYSVNIYICFRWSDEANNFCRSRQNQLSKIWINNLQQLNVVLLTHEGDAEWTNLWKKKTNLNF